MARNKEIVNDVITDIPHYRVSFDVEAFDTAIRSQGVKLIHYQALRCPIGMTNLDDHQRPHPDHEGCSNGFLFTKVGVITGLFTSNSKHKNAMELGFWDGSTVQVTFPRQYDDNPDRKLYVAPFDRFFLAEGNVVVPTWQLFLYDESGINKLKYPVEEVQDIVDSQGLRYRQCDDFVIENGAIKWVGKRPAQQIDLGPGMGNGFGTDRGSVCSVRYTYRPYWFVGQMMHEIRVTQVTEEADGRHLERMPQAAILHREYVALTKEQDQSGLPTSRVDADTLRNVLGSLYSGFGQK